MFVKKVRGSGVELRLEFRQTRNPKGGSGRLDYRSYQMQNLEQDPEDSPRYPNFEKALAWKLLKRIPTWFRVGV